MVKVKRNEKKQHKEDERRCKCQLEVLVALRRGLWGHGFQYDIRLHLGK